jgi:hypothetical protein
LAGGFLTDVSTQRQEPAARDARRVRLVIAS